jgi:drug/metabolite transporter (DMT)-like permease
VTVAERPLEHTTPAPSRTWLPTAAVVVTRLLVASVVLAALVFRRPRRWPQPRDWPLLLLCGAAWLGVYNLALNAAEQRIDAGTAALVIQVGPLLVALLATVFLDEAMTRWLASGMIVGFAGVVIIGRGSASAGHGDLVGVLLAALAAVTYAIGVLAQKPLLRRLPGLEVTFVACLVGVLVSLPWAGDLVHTVRTGSTADLAWIAYLGVFPTAIAFSTWAFALSYTDAGTMALTTFLVPFLATGMAWLALGEVPAVTAFLGGALCIVGVLLTRRPVRRSRRPVRPSE